MPVTPDIFGNLYPYRACILEDTGDHFDSIKVWIPEAEHLSFQERMMECVDAGNAWCTENTFLYYEKVNRKISYGVALYGREHAVELIGLFIGVFWHEDKDTGILRFKLHKGKLMEEYKALLTTISIKRTHQNPDHPLMVRVDELRKKFHHILAEQDPNK